MLTNTCPSQFTKRVAIAAAIALSTTTLTIASSFSPTLTPSATAAATFVVNSTSDVPDVNPGDGSCAASGGACTLRAALEEANALAGADRIELPTGTFTVASSALSITSDIELRGAGAAQSIVDLDGTTGLLVLAPANVTLNVTIAGLTIRGGNSQAGGGLNITNGTATPGNATVAVEDVVIRDNVGFTGGGGVAIGTGKRVTMRRVTIDANSSTGAFGGGIWNAGTLIIDDSTISRNQANRAGAIHNTSTAAILVLRNVTVSGNTAVSPGSGTGGIVNQGFANLISTTITNNRGVGTTTANLLGGGIYTVAGATTVAKNSVIAGNRNSSSPNGPPSGPQDCVGNLTADTRYMLIQDTTGCGLPGAQQGFITGVSANLGPLQSNGGATETHFPAAGSPVIDAGYPFPTGTAAADACPANDQRAVPRLICDLGAVEVEVPIPTSLVVTSPQDEIDVLPGNGTCNTASGGCSLRAAVMEANRLPGLQTINVQPGTYPLTIPPNEGGFEPAEGGDLDVSDQIAIVGSGAASTIIDANGASRVFEGVYGVAMSFAQVTLRGGQESGFGGGIAAGYDSAVTLTDVVLRNNRGLYGGGLHSSGGTVNITRTQIIENSTSFGSGGGVSADGSLTMTSSRVELNTAGSSGGGIQAGQAVITRSTITGNQTTAGSGWGGGISVGSLTMTASTVANNSSVQQGGGIFMSGGTITNSTVTGNRTGTEGGGISTNGESTLTHVTVVGNRSNTGQGNGLMAFGSGAGFIVRNSIIYNVTKGGGPECVRVAAQRSFGSVAGDGSCNLVGAYVGNPLLGPLGSNGGPTQTRVPQAGSPAIDLATQRLVRTDQRGFARPSGPAYDAGAVEVRPTKEKSLSPESDQPSETDKPAESDTPSDAVDEQQQG